MFFKDMMTTKYSKTIHDRAPDPARGNRAPTPVPTNSWKLPSKFTCGSHIARNALGSACALMWISNSYSRDNSNDFWLLANNSHWKSEETNFVWKWRILKKFQFSNCFNIWKNFLFEEMSYNRNRPGFRVQGRARECKMFANGFYEKNRCFLTAESSSYF